MNALTSPVFSPLYQEHGPLLPRLPVPTVVKRRVISSGGCGGGRGGGCQSVRVIIFVLALALRNILRNITLLYNEIIHTDLLDFLPIKISVE